MLKRITFIHLFNDYSGSPLVLSTVIRGLRDRGYVCRLMTSKGTQGFLSNIERVEEVPFKYRFVENKLIRLLFFFWTQIVLFFKVWQSRKELNILYVNTFLPFGAAIAGKLSGVEVIYHIHETSVKPPILKSWLRWVAQRCATKSIYVSEYLNTQERLSGVPAHTVYNALREDFVKQANLHVNNKKMAAEPFHVLMLCSLKAYKGLNEFVSIAKKMPGTTFSLVLNATQNLINQYFEGQSLPSNLKIYPSQSNVHPFYQSANLVLNLSHPKQWIETFGMTLLEGMAYGIPCIVPQVGGPAEIVNHGINGYKLDHRELDSIVSHISKLSMAQQLYSKMAENARFRSRDFSYKAMINGIHAILISKSNVEESIDNQAFTN